MSATREGGLKAGTTNRQRHGMNYYVELGKMGGKAQHSKPRGFASEVVGADGLTGKERASTAGAIGGATSRRPASREASKLTNSVPYGSI